MPQLQTVCRLRYPLLAGELHSLRGEGYPNRAGFSNPARSEVGQVHGDSQSADGLGPRRAGGAPAGQGWPGRALGVREPYPSETSLSWAEVIHGVEIGIFKVEQ